MKSKTVYVPELATFLNACEGDGSNLTLEDEENGYVDYVYITTYTWNGSEMTEEDGGMLLLTEPFSEKYGGDTYEVGDRMVSDAMEYMWDEIYPYVDIKEV